MPVHLQKAYDFLGLGPGSFPVDERCAREFLSLPMYPELPYAQIPTVAQEVRQILADEARGEACVA